jgi:HSP20 family protein
MRNVMLPVFGATRGPFDAFAAFERAFDDVMRPAGGGAFGFNAGAQGASPPVDVRVDEEKIVLQFDVPGYRGEDVEITVDKGVLTVKGQRKLESKGKNERVWVGRSYGNFTRSFALSDGIDEKGLSADLADGVLTVTLPKVAPVKPRRIEVRSAQAGAPAVEAPAAPEAGGEGVLAGRACAPPRTAARAFRAPPPCPAGASRGAWPGVSFEGESPRGRGHR